MKKKKQNRNSNFEIRISNYLAILLCSLAIAAPAGAQHARTGYSGFEFVTPLQISAGNDSNFLIDRSSLNERLFFLSLSPTVQSFAPSALPKQTDDKVMLIALPTTAFVKDTVRRKVAVTYQPEFELYVRNTDQNATNHVATADFIYALSRRVQINLSDSFRNSSDPSRTLQNVFLLLPRGSYMENSFRGSLTYGQSELTSIGVRFDHTITKFGQVDQFQRRVLDTIGTGISLVGTRMLTRNQRVRATYSVFNARPINQQGVGDEQVDQDRPGQQAAHSLTAEYRFSPNLSTVMEFTGGGVKTAFGTNMVFGGAYDRRIRTMWLGGGYSRSVSFFAGGSDSFATGIAPTAFYELAFFRLRGQPTRRIGIQLTGIISRSVDSTFAEDSKAALARARIDYRVSERTVLFLNAETYQQNRNEWVNSPVSRNRFFAGVEFSFANEYQRRTSRLNRDADNVALTEWGRRRLPRR